MQALGLIETRGLIVAVESADAMLKAADVALLEKTFVGGGLVSIAVTGEVAAVKAAVDAGAAAVRQINAELLVSQHVIPRPHEELDNVMVSAIPLKDLETVTEIIQVCDNPIEETENNGVEQVEVENTLHVDQLEKEEIDKIAAEKGLEEAVKILNKLKVIKLRTLARDYKDFGIAGRLISKADKKMLIAEFVKYYEK